MSQQERHCIGCRQGQSNHSGHWCGNRAQHCTYPVFGILDWEGELDKEAVGQRHNQGKNIAEGVHFIILGGLEHCVDDLQTPGISCSI